jgi:two-component system sensor histidine kinase KdpD
MAEDLARLDRSIGNLLDVSRLEAQAWLPKPERFEVGELIGSIVSDLSKAVRERVRYEVPRGIPFICADFVQSSRALRHIVDNALQYSTGTVTIGGEPEASGFVSIWVEDQGPGIPEDELERVFEKFYRGTAGRHSRSSTGLGLSLAKEIVVANGGEIRIEAVRPSGTRLVLVFPAEEESHVE